MNRVVGVIGAGNMGSALVKGWLRAGASGLVVWDKFDSAVQKLLAAAQTPAVPPQSVCPLSAASSLEELVAASDTVFVVVKPKDAQGLLGLLGPMMRPEQTVVSAMAGLTLEWLRDALGTGPALYRAMPNLAVELGAGAVAVAVESGVDPAAVEPLLVLFRQLGLVEVIPEELFDVVTAVSGSSPAFFALAVEGLEDGAVAAGMSRADARRVVRQATLDAAHQNLASVGQACLGVTELLEERKLRLAFQNAVAAAMERSRQMRKV